MMHHLFIDESGELGSKAGSSRFFLITLLSTQSLKALEKRLWKEKAKLYNEGWPKSVEIKGTSLWGAEHNKNIPRKLSEKRVDILNGIVESICSSDVKILYSVAQKCFLKPRLLEAEYGIVYNFLTGSLITKSYSEHLNFPLDIIVDQRSKETHSKLKFDGYIETKLVAECNHPHSLSIRHAESHDVPGLQAVDFISWGLFRHYEHGDSQFKTIIDQKVAFRDDWYSWKRQRPTA